MPASQFPVINAGTTLTASLLQSMIPYAANTSSATATVVKAGSLLSVRRLA